MTLDKANSNNLDAIWEIIQQAIEQRRQDGSDQWQNGYPLVQVLVFNPCEAGTKNET